MIGTEVKHSMHNQIIVHEVVIEYVIISAICVSYRPAANQIARKGIMTVTGGMNLRVTIKNCKTFLFENSKRAKIYAKGTPTTNPISNAPPVTIRLFFKPVRSRPVEKTLR